MDYKLYPSLLFTPGNKPERFGKAAENLASGIILDLEDSVPLSQKNEARTHVLQYLSDDSANNQLLNLIRINSLSTKEGLTDLLAIANEKPVHCHGVIHPKTESAEILNIINEVLCSAGIQIPLFAIIETGKGLARVDAIVTDANNIAGLLFGAADYGVDVGTQLTQQALLWARSKLVNAAAIKQVACYDTPTFHFKDSKELQEDINHIVALGFSGKLAIHPNQIKSINAGFTPSLESYQDAKKVIAIYEAAKGSACEYNGKMIDVPIYTKAKRIEIIFETLHKKELSA